MKHPQLIALLCLFCTSVVLAQNKPAAPPKATAKPRVAAQPAPAEKPAEGKDDDRLIIEHADNFRYDPDTKIYHMTGNVVFANKDMKLYCDQADYNEEADTARAWGHLRAVDPNSVITGDLLEADFNQDLAIITGSVTVVTQKKNKVGEKPQPALEKPAPAGATLATNKPHAAPEQAAPSKNDQNKEPETFDEYWENKTTITCERLEYYFADDVKRMIATPRVKAVQEDKTVWADRAVHEDLLDLLTLTGNVVLTKTNGDEMRCNKAVISTEEDWIQAEGMSGVTLRKKKDGTADKPAEPAPAPAASPPAQPAPAPLDPRPAVGTAEAGG